MECVGYSYYLFMYLVVVLLCLGANSWALGSRPKGATEDLAVLLFYWLKKILTRDESELAIIPYKVVDLSVSHGTNQVHFNRTLVARSNF